MAIHQCDRDHLYYAQVLLEPVSAMQLEMSLQDRRPILRASRQLCRHEASGRWIFKAAQKKVRDGNASQEEDIVHRSFVDLSFGPIRMDMMKWVILN